MTSETNDSDTPIDATTYFQTPGERHEKGSGMTVIAAEREATVLKTLRLKAAREEQQALQAKVDADAARLAAPKPKPRSRRK
jgi:hypothetical protein